MRSQLTLVDSPIIGCSQRHQSLGITTLEILLIIQVLIHLGSIHRTRDLRRVQPRSRTSQRRSRSVRRLRDMIRGRQRSARAGECLRGRWGCRWREWRRRRDQVVRPNSFPWLGDIVLALLNRNRLSESLRLTIRLLESLLLVIRRLSIRLGLLNRIWPRYEGRIDRVAVFPGCHCGVVMESSTWI